MEMATLVPDAMRETFIDCVNRIAIRVNCDFERRVMSVIKRFPYRMFWFAYRPHTEECPERKAVAAEVLGPASTEVNACEIIAKIRKVLEDCVNNNGVIAFPLYAVWRVIATQFVGDNQEKEGVMNLIKANANACPGSTQALIDARCGNNKSIGMGSRSEKRRKWSEVAPRFNELVSEAVEHADGINEVLGKPHRFTPPLPILRNIDTTVLRRTKLHLSPECLEWASSQNLMFQRDANRNELLNVGSGMVCLDTVVAAVVAGTVGDDNITKLS